MGSPMTFIILPKVSGPTGILIGAPVSRTLWPRTRPSVPSIAIVLTVFSPEDTHGKGQWFIPGIWTRTAVFKHAHFSTLTKMLCHLEHQPAVTVRHLQCVENGREAFIKLDVHHSTNYCHYAAIGQSCLSSRGTVSPAWKDNDRNTLFQLDWWLQTIMHSREVRRAG